MFRKTLIPVLFLAVLVAGPSLVQAAGTFNQTFTGSTVGGPTWNRPVSTSTLSGSCTACSYSVQVFELAAASGCYLVSSQNYDGHMVLYRNSFNAAAPLTNLVDLDDDGELVIGTSRIPSNLDTASIALAAGRYYIVTSAFSNGNSGSYSTTIHCTDAQPTQGSCGYSNVDDDQEVCLSERFAVAINGISNHPTDGIATPARFGSKESAFFWFYNDQNFEVMIKVLNGCGVNGHWWVFAGALTDQAYHIQVHDFVSGTDKHYSNTLGTHAAAVTDVNAFPCP